MNLYLSESGASLFQPYGTERLREDRALARITGRAMARFYFDIHDSDGFHRDESGDEFASLDEAREQAQSLLPDIVREELPDGDLHSITCDVRDEVGRIVYRGKLTFEGTRDPA